MEDSPHRAVGSWALLCKAEMALQDTCPPGGADLKSGSPEMLGSQTRKAEVQKALVNQQLGA